MDYNQRKPNPVYLVKVGNPETVFHSLFFIGMNCFYQYNIFNAAKYEEKSLGTR